jgi:hypothetical protein
MVFRCIAPRVRPLAPLRSRRQRPLGGARRAARQRGARGRGRLLLGGRGARDDKDAGADGRRVAARAEKRVCAAITWLSATAPRLFSTETRCAAGAAASTWSEPEYLRAALPAGRRDALTRLRCAPHFLRVDGAVDAHHRGAARRRRGAAARAAGTASVQPARRPRPRAPPRRRRASAPRARSVCAAAPAARSRTRRT